jgi:hypothetical protein
VASDADRKAIQTLLGALSPLFDLKNSIPLPFVTALLVVALDEGKGVADYAKTLGLHRTKMARYFRDIGHQARDGGPGLGLVAVNPHPSKPFPYRQVVLTEKGRAMADQMLRAMRRVASR